MNWPFVVKNALSTKHQQETLQRPNGYRRQKTWRAKSVCTVKPNMRALKIVSCIHVWGQMCVNTLLFLVAFDRRYTSGTVCS